MSPINKKKYMKLVLGSFDRESRDKRELEVARDYGFDISVCCSEYSEKYREEDSIRNLKVFTYKTKNSTGLGNQIENIIKIIRIVKIIVQSDLDVICCHDLWALLIGYLAKVLLVFSNNISLIYDSHEFELGRASRRTKLTTKFVRFIEGYLIHRVKFSIVVNDSISKKIKEIYSLTKSPIVIRSIPYYSDFDNKVIYRQKKVFYKQYGFSSNSLILMYHGAIQRDRGIELLIECVSEVKKVHLIILGDGNEKYIGFLKEYCSFLEVQDKILFLPAISSNNLWKIVGIADLGVVLIPGVYESYKMMLPNKFFENIQSEVPVLCSDFPEIRKIVDKYKIGILVDPDDKKQIIETIKNINNNREQLDLLKRNVLIAKSELTWGNEQKKLMRAYSKYL